MILDLQGNIVSIVQIIALLLLTVGVYPYRIRTKNRNLIMHGFLSITALALNLATIFYVMIPTFLSSTGVFGELSIVQAAVVLIHVGFGVATVAAGLVIIISWVRHPLGELGCAKTWRFMIPTFVIWAFTLIMGLIIHFYGIL